MKIAFLSIRPPYPLDGGNRIRTFHLLNGISQVHDVVLITAVEGPDDGAALAAIREHIPRLIVRAVKVPSRNTPLRRLLRVVRSPLDPLPYTWAAYRDRRFIRHVRAVVQEGDFDLVHCDHIQVAHALFGLKTPPRLLNAHNIESVLVRRVAENESASCRKALITWQYRKMRRIEAATHRHFDRSLVVSEVDRAELKRLAPELSISVVPNGVDTDRFAPAGIRPAPNVMVFTGVMDWLPNVDGVTFFAREVLPRISRSVPQAEWWVVGRNPAPSLVRYLQSQGIRVTGAVDDIRPYLAQAGLVVVPLRIGGGTRLKILEAWAMGKAVLSTSVGAEGLPVVDGENIALADAAECMAERAAALLNDAAQGARLGAAGRRVVEEHFSWKMIADRLRVAYEETARRPGLWSPPAAPDVVPSLPHIRRGARVSQAGRAG